MLLASVILTQQWREWVRENSAHRQSGRSSTHLNAGFGALEQDAPRTHNGATRAEPLSSQGGVPIPFPRTCRHRSVNHVGLQVRSPAFHVLRAAPSTSVRPPLPSTHHRPMTTVPGGYGMLFSPFALLSLHPRAGPLTPCQPSGRGAQIKTDRRVLPTFRGLTKP